MPRPMTMTGPRGIRVRDTPQHSPQQNQDYMDGSKLERTDSANTNAKSNLGTYEAVPPPGMLADPQNKKGWEMSKLGIEILPAEVICTRGQGLMLPPAHCNIIPAKPGDILVAKYDYSPLHTVYWPIYLFDKNTIFAMGFKLMREKDSEGIEESDE
jgi:hypothetical protein